MADPGDKIKEAAEQQKAVAEQQQKLKGAFEAVAQTEAGQIVLAHLMNKCLFHVSTLALSPTGEINAQAMIHNEARRRVYLFDIRPFIPINIRRKIEN